MVKYKLIILCFLLFLALFVNCCASGNSPESNLNPIRLKSSEWTSGEFFVVDHVDYVFKSFPESVEVPSGILSVDRTRVINEQQRNINESGISLFNGVMIVLFGFGVLMIPVSIGLLISYWYHKIKGVSDPGDADPKAALIVLFIGILFVAQAVLLGPNSPLHAPVGPLDPVETRGWYFNSTDNHSSSLWIDNGRSQPVIVYNQVGNETYEIPAKSIVELVVSSGILHMELKTHDGLYLKSVNLYINPSLSGSIFIYNIDNENRYKFERTYYCKFCH